MHDLETEIGNYALVLKRQKKIEKGYHAVLCIFAFKELTTGADTG